VAGEFSSVIAFAIHWKTQRVFRLFSAEKESTPEAMLNTVAELLPDQPQG
jgi:hypothetical protein